MRHGSQAVTSAIWLLIQVVAIFGTMPEAQADWCRVDLAAETSDPERLYSLVVGKHGDGIAVCLGEEDLGRGLTAPPELVARAGRSAGCADWYSEVSPADGAELEELVILVAGHNVVLTRDDGSTTCSDPYGLALAGAEDVRLEPYRDVAHTDESVRVRLTNELDATETRLEMVGLDSVVTCDLNSGEVYAVYGMWGVALGYNPYTMIVCETAWHQVRCMVDAPYDSDDVVDILAGSQDNDVESPGSRVWCQGTGMSAYYVDPWYASWQGFMGLYGEDGEDFIYGSPNGDVIEGNDDDDHVYGEDGDDRIDGNGGLDHLYGGEGEDTVYANSHCCSDSDGASDLVYGGVDGDDLYADEGGDRLRGEGGVDYLYGNVGEDEILGGTERDYIYAGDGDDDIEGNAGDDVIYGEGGNDTIEGGTQYDWIYAGGQAGDDVDGGGDCARCTCSGGGTYAYCEDVPGTSCPDDC